MLLILYVNKLNKLNKLHKLYKLHNHLKLLGLSPNPLSS